MQIIKKQIELTGRGYSFEIPLTTKNEFTGYQQEIDNYTQIRSTADINDVTDGEITRLKLATGIYTKQMEFQFAINPTAWNSRFTLIGFTNSEITGNSSNFLNSFFILDFFDTFNTNSQTKIISTYLTNLAKNNEDDNPINSAYRMTSDFQLFELNVPKYYINSAIITGYSRFSFYNAKTGNISVFYNADNGGLTTPEKMFFKTRIDRENKTWDFLTSSNTGTEPKFIARELVNSQEYIDKFNETFENFDNLQQGYPTGSTFDYKTASYIAST